MDWKILLAGVTGSVDDELLRHARFEYWTPHALYQVIIDREQGCQNPLPFMM
jgi:hypothetical protein